MPETKVPPTPKGLAVTGRRLWREIHGAYELGHHETLLLTEACRVADRLQRLAEESEGAPLTVTNFKGDEVASPLLVEARLQGVTLARLVASLRLPDDQDSLRPQRRGAARGVYQGRSQWARSS